MPFCEIQGTYQFSCKSSKAKLEKVGPNLNLLLTDPGVQIATPTQIQGTCKEIKAIPVMDFLVWSYDISISDLNYLRQVHVLLQNPRHFSIFL